MALRKLQNLQYSRFFVMALEQLHQIFILFKAALRILHFNGNCKIHKFRVFSSDLYANASQCFSLCFVHNNSGGSMGEARGARPP